MKRIDKYVIIEEIGRGGMGIVYKALHPFLNRYIAIKVLPEHFINEKEFVERFTNEAKTIINLKHPNIVRLYDAGIYMNNYYIVMDYIEGKTLKDLIKINKKFDIKEATDIIIPIAKALSYAHSKGVIHRDIKPSNIIIEDETKQPYLYDFGIAKAAYGTKLTLTGISIGTPEYMSPEQCKGEEVDQRTDIYSLGIVFYEMLTGKVPFEGDTPLGVAYKHVNEIAARPRIFNPQISSYLEKIILKMIAKNLDERYASMDEVIEDLILFKEEKFDKIKAIDFEVDKCILTIKTNPAGTKVYINGEYIGISPIENLVINFGDYNFVFISPEFKDFSKKIKLN
ncbi:MAG: serine/threonine-protein kinase, partial [Caldisericia bacterium]